MRWRFPCLAVVAVSMAQLTTAEAASPSFNCSAASSAVEILICRDENLAAADVQLAEKFQKAIANEGRGSGLVAEQRVWLQLRATICGLPERGALSPTLDAARPTSCLNNLYRNRLAALDSRVRAQAIDCQHQDSAIDQLVCADPQLLASDRKVEEAWSNALQDGYHRTQVQQDQSEWRVWLAGRFASAWLTDKNRDPLRKHLGAAYEVRLAQLEASGSRTLAPVETINLPSDWWGIDIVRQLSRDDLSIDRAFLRDTGTLVVETGPKTDGTIPMGEIGKGERYILADVISGQVIANGRDRPDLIHTGGAALKLIYDGFGLSEINYIGRLYEFPITSSIYLTVGSSNCPAPVRHAIEYGKYGESYRFPGRYIVARLPHPKSFPYNRPRCANGEGDKWSADFEPLFTQFVSEVSDGTFLAIVGGRYVVRFRPDLTSPFFVGRSDVVVVPQDAVDRLSDEDGGPSGPLALRAVKAIVDEAARAQVAAGKIK